LIPKPEEITDKANVTVTYTFPPGSEADAGSFYDQLQGIGVPIVGSPSVGGTTTQTLTCKSKVVVVDGVAGVGVECSWD
jgi:hypothetical protein